MKDANYYNQSAAAGLLGGLRELQKKAPSLELAFSVGGWTMSGYFSEVAADKALRLIFVESVVDFFTRFPMFSSVDIDWEYPGGGGLPGNGSSDEDGENYALLIGELRTALDAFDKGQKKITIASSADVNKIDNSNIKGLIEAGLDNIFLMSYDFFGTGWSENLAHHTNLYPTNASPYSIDTAINYLLNTLDVSPSMIHLGYANYARSATGANITSLDYDIEGLALGSFENGAPEFFDVLFNYLDLENGTAQGKNGFELMTDTVANADYLYSSETNHFISFDTPRTVKAKGEYVITKGLAGAFSWSADQDDGLLANAAREGMGYQITQENFDMDTVYNDGKHSNLDLETTMTKNR
jgi:chitinase